MHAVVHVSLYLPCFDSGLYSMIVKGVELHLALMLLSSKLLMIAFGKEAIFS